MDELPANISYRSLELLCLQQAKLSATPKAKRELELMASEYKQLADWQEQQWSSRTSPVILRQRDRDD